MSTIQSGPTAHWDTGHRRRWQYYKKNINTAKIHFLHCSVSGGRSTGTTTRTYDELNRVLTKTVPVIGTSTYTYDITTGLTTGYVGEQLYDPASNVTLKVYDKVGRLYSVTDGSDVTTYSYYDNGAKESVTYNNGAKEEYEYDEGILLTELINRKADGTIMDTYTYTYDDAHNQLTKYESINGVVKGTTTYTYDELNRLLTVTEPGGKVTTYTYDEAGNRETETIVDGSDTTVNIYIYNSQNRLTAVQERLNTVMTNLYTYTYDNNGNQTVITRTPYIGGIPQTPVTQATNTYDGFNQLTQTVKDGTTIANVYNGEGLRVKKTVGSAVTRYMYERTNIVLETDNSGNETARNVYGSNLILRELDGDSYYYFYNGHADVTALMDTDTDAIDASYYYDAFGNILESTGSVDNSIKYAGYQYDDETGYYYLNARMYDPITARFLQEDTYTGDPNDPLSLNLYTYVSNNPLIYYDPTGHIQEQGAGPVLGKGNGNPDEDWGKKWEDKKKKDVVWSSTERLKEINREIQIRGALIAEIYKIIDDMWGNDDYVAGKQEEIDIQTEFIYGLAFEKSLIMTRYGLGDVAVEVDIDLSPWDNEAPGYFEQVWDNIADGACARWDKKYDSFYDAVNFASFGRVESVNDSFYRMMHRDMYDVFTFENGMDALNVGGEFIKFAQLGTELGNIISNATPVLNGGGTSTSPATAAKMYDAAAYSSQTQRVGRWMSQEEYINMLDTGKVQMSPSGNTAYVSNPADPNVFKAASTGSVYVEFDVPTNSIFSAGNDLWGQIPGPGSLVDRFNQSQGLPSIFEMPDATNIQIIGGK